MIRLLLPSAASGAVILLLILLNLFPGRFPIISFYLALTALVMLPGASLSGILFRRYKFTASEWAALSFSLGLVAITPFSVVAFIFNFPVNSFFYWSLYLLCLPAACWFVFFSRWAFSLEDSTPSPDESAGDRQTLAILWAVTLIAILSAFLLVGNIHYSADYYGILALMEQYLNHPGEYGMSPYFRGEYYSVVHLYLTPLLLTSSLAQASGLTVYSALAYMQPVLGLVSVCAYFFFMHSIFRHRALALFITLLLVAVRTGLPGGFPPLSLWEATSLPDFFAGQVMLPTAFALVFTGLRGESRNALFASGILGAVMFQFSNTNFMLFFLGLIFFGSCQIIFNPRDRECIRRLVYVGLWGTALALPLFLIRFYHPAMGQFQPTDKYYPDRLIHLSPSIFYFNPLDYVYHSQFPLLATAAAPLLLVFRQKRWAIFLFSTLVIPPLIQFVPPLATWSSKILTYVFIRKLLSLQMWLPVLGLFFYLVLLRLPEKAAASGGWIKLARRALPYTIAALAAALLFAAVMIFTIETPAFRAELRSLFQTRGLGVVWTHKHLLFVIVPLLFWILLAGLWELFKKGFSRKSDRPFFSALDKDQTTVPLLFASLLGCFSLFYGVPSAALEKVRQTGYLFQALEDRLGPPPGMRFLKKYVNDRGIVLTEPETGWVLPAYCDHYVFTVYARRAAGLQKQTWFEEKLRFVDSLLNSRELVSPDQFRRLKEYDISYVYLDKSRTDPEIIGKFEGQPEYFLKIFESRADVIFSVLRIH